MWDHYYLQTLAALLLHSIIIQVFIFPAFVLNENSTRQVQEYLQLQLQQQVYI